MTMGGRLPALILFAIILSGGFGIARMIVVPHDLIGISAIAMALVLVAIYKRVVSSGHPHASRASMPASKSPINLASAASDSFEFFPGRSEGYVGYTEYTAMAVEVNDDLAARKPAEQYALLGFGNGFLKGIRDRLGDREDKRIHFRVIDASLPCKESIGWLNYLQQSGTDNAGPSTENLHSAIQSVSKDIRSKGPIIMGFWNKVHNKLDENLDASSTSLAMLEEWMTIYQAAFVEGQQHAIGAAAINGPI